MSNPTQTNAIRDLRTESGSAGDLSQVAICDMALSGDAAAIAECLRVIGDARAADMAD